MKKRLLAMLLVFVLVVSAIPGALALKSSTLRLGNKDSDFDGETPVSEMQYRLQFYGFYDDAIDGVFGATMVTAVKAFQKKNGITADGYIGSQTRAKLLSDSAKAKTDADFVALSLGDYGDRVMTLQAHLQDTMFYRGALNSTFTDAVKTAVMEFQQAAGLTADGVVGEKTWNALMNRTPSIFNGGYPIRVLKPGNAGYDVYIVQQRLITLKYLSSTANGYFNTATEAAVRAFQAANGVTVTGTVNSMLRRYLWPSETDAGEKADEEESVVRVLTLGSSGSAVANVQMRLKAAGYLFGKADGIFGQLTKAAVIKVQKDYNLKADGKVGAQTLAIINTFDISSAEPGAGDDNTTDTPATVLPTSSIKYGATGTTVKLIQEKLIVLGHLADGEADGKFGAKTQRAVIRFQKAHGLKQDGIVGTETLSKLNYYASQAGV